MTKEIVIEKLIYTYLKGIKTIYIPFLDSVEATLQSVAKCGKSSAENYVHLTPEIVHCCENSAVFAYLEVEKNCDEWIEVCLQKYDCKVFLFVVDEVERYKNYVAETLKGSGKKVVLIHA